MTTKRPRLIRDPLYGYIALPEDLAPVVDHPLYQRLRRVHQTSLTSAVYPSATGSRFEHGLGAMHLAAQGWTSAWENAIEEVRNHYSAAARAEILGRFPADQAQVFQLVRLGVGCAALLHDIGHPPFSHVLEPVYEEFMLQHLSEDPVLLDRWNDYGGPLHEFAGSLLSAQIAEVLPDPLKRVFLAIYEADPDGPTWAGVAHSIVAGEVDVDRLDYLMRDGQKAGTEFGSIDYDRLIGSLELHTVPGGFRIAPGIRARSAVETLLIQRSQAYKWITFHHRVVGSNLALARAMTTLVELAERDETLASSPSPVGVGFRQLFPNLNYLAPGFPSALAQIQGAGTHGNVREADQLALDDQVRAALATQLRLDLQAGVDDATIVQLLKAALMQARLIQTTGSLSEDLRVSLLRLTTFIRAALFRSKNFITAWKTVEEFAEAMKLCRTALEPAVLEAFDEAIGQLDNGTQDNRQLLLEQREVMASSFQDNPVTTANQIIGRLLSNPYYRSILRRQLDQQRSELKGALGFWEVEYTSFHPVRTSGKLTTLFRGDETYPLGEYSPLVQALAGVEAQRPKLFLFFFLFAPATYDPWEDRQVHEARAMLIGDFISLLPQFVASFLPQELMGSIGTPKGATS